MSETASKGSILIVDDDEFLVDMYSMKFTQSGYTVRACLRVLDAIEALKSGFSPDVILFDIIMPELDGISLLEALAEQHLAKYAVKIALTNQQNDADRERVQSLGGDAFLIKATLLPSEVVAHVEDIIAKKSKK
jgi:CheY-like chemotaxis protein